MCECVCVCVCGGGSGVCVCGGDINPIKCPMGVAFYAKGGKEGIFSLKCSKSITAKYSQTSMARTPLGP